MKSNGGAANEQMEIAVVPGRNKEYNQCIEIGKGWENEKQRGNNPLLPHI